MTQRRTGAGSTPVKVAFVLEGTTEWLWAEKLASDAYRLLNSPFLVYDVSYQDIVTARDTDGRLTFVAVRMRGGHSTYRVMLSERLVSDTRVDWDALDPWWKPLDSRGCKFERAVGRLLSLDVPPQADIGEIHEHLRAGQDAGVWEFEEGHVGHLGAAPAPPAPTSPAS